MSSSETNNTSKKEKKAENVSIYSSKAREI